MRDPTKEEIDACLSCTRPPNACNTCGGPNAGRGVRGYPKETKEAALAMHDLGMQQYLIAEALGISQGVISQWLKKRSEGKL